MVRSTITFAMFLFTFVAIGWFADRLEWRTDDGAAVAAEPDRQTQPATPRRMPAEFKLAGVCARCHVVSVLEWSVSGHPDQGTDCVQCHGPSRKHVTDERNEAKPDYVPTGAAIAEENCLTCHKAGCRESLEVDNCQKCHHVHALVNPTKPPQIKDDRLADLVARWQKFGKMLANGDRHVDRQEWKAAQQSFCAALELIPGNHRARMQLEMCSRRLDPKLPGFEIIGEEFDDKTGLLREVAVTALKIPMLLVPPGEFDMGSDKWPDSRPVHTVPLDAFYLGRYEVTQAEWSSVMGANPSAHQGKDFADSGRMPVENVSWDDCQEFLRRLNKRVPGGGFRLPTEAEWEYACRAGSRPLGDEELTEHAWFRANSLRKPKPDQPFLQVDAYAPRPVGTRKQNAWGFADMQGNVSEWCSSLCLPYPYQAADGRESHSQVGMRVVRGGGFADSSSLLDPALRHTERPQRRLRFNGLRLARTVPRVGHR